jgi:hypothetical protein
MVYSAFLVLIEPQHFLNFLPEPQGQGSLGPAFLSLRAVTIGFLGVF